MKKFLSIMLAAAMTLTMSVAAFAEGEPTTGASASEEKEFTFTKTYTINGAEAKEADPFPAEKLEFNVNAAEGNPDNTMITIEDHTVEGNPGDVVVGIPSYSQAGKWNYTINEAGGVTQGVEYLAVSFDVQVFVSYESDGSGGYTNQLVTDVVITTEDNIGNKITGIVNNYKIGNLKVSKAVTGNMASKDAEFTIKVTLTSDQEVLSAITYNGDEIITPQDWTKEDDSWTVEKEITLKHDEDLTFANIPADVTYKVIEDSKHTNNADAESNDITKGYEGTYTYSDNTLTINGAETDTVAVLNTKGTEIATGIGLDSLPYMILLVGAMVGLSVVVLKKRQARED